MWPTMDKDNEKLVYIDYSCKIGQSHQTMLQKKPWFMTSKEEVILVLNFLKAMLDNLLRKCF